MTIRGARNGQAWANFDRGQRDCLNRDQMVESAPGSALRTQVRPDEDDDHTLLVRYPAASPADAYVRPAINIELGAKSALDPNTVQIIRTYVIDDAPGLDLPVANVTTVEPGRTFWDKAVTLHGLRRRYVCRRKPAMDLKKNGRRKATRQKRSTTTHPRHHHPLGS